MPFKVLNTRTLISSREEITLSVYLHDGANMPVLGVTTLGYHLYDINGLVSSGIFVESAVPGVYSAEVETPLTDPLEAGTYTIVIFEGTSTVVISNEDVSNQYTGIGGYADTAYTPIVDISGAVSSDPADVIVTVTPIAGSLVGVPAALAIDGDTGRVDFDNSTMLIEEVEPLTLDGDPNGVLSSTYTVARPYIVKPDGSAIADDASADISLNTVLLSGTFLNGDQLANASVDATSVTFAVQDFVVQDSYSDPSISNVVITVPNATFLVDSVGAVTSSIADVQVTVNSDIVVPVSVNGTTKEVDLTGVASIGDDVTVSFYRIPDASDSVELVYNRLPTSSGDVVQLTYNIPGLIDVVMFEKGPDLAAAELLLEENQQKTFHVATDNILSRNVVRGAVEGYTVKTKRFSDSDFDNPVTEGRINFSYRDLSLQSDIVLSEPEE